MRLADRSGHLLDHGHVSVSLSAYCLRILSERLGRFVGIPTRLHFSAIYRLAELIIHNDNRVDTLPFIAKKRR